MQSNYVVRTQWCQVKIPFSLCIAMPTLRIPLRAHSRGRKLWVRSLIALFIIFVLTYSAQVVLTFIGSSPSSGRLNCEWLTNSFRENYKENQRTKKQSLVFIFHYADFLEGDEHLKLGYIVNTPACRILNISAWDKSILPFLSNVSQRSDCHKNRKWTYTENSVKIKNQFIFDTKNI